MIVSFLQTAVFVKALKDQRHLEMSFPFPDPSPFYLAKPSSFLSHLIGHEGKGSILSCLKNKGWANVVSAGGTNGAKGFDFFKVQVDLTKEGLGNLSLLLLSFHRQTSDQTASPLLQNTTKMLPPSSSNTSI